MSDKDNWDEAPEAGNGSSTTWDQTTVLIGKFLKAKENVGPNGSMLYEVRADDGEVFGVWGSSVLDNKFSDVPAGSRIRLEYLGKKTNPKTNREFKDYKLQYKEPDLVAEANAAFAGKDEKAAE